MGEQQDHRAEFRSAFQKAVAESDTAAVAELLKRETWKLELGSQRMLWALWQELSDAPRWARDALKNAMVAQENGECVDPHAVNLARCPFCFRLCACMVVDVCKHYVAFASCEMPFEDGLASSIQEIEDLREDLGVQFSSALTETCPRIRKVVALADGERYEDDAAVWEFISGGKTVVVQQSYDGYGYSHGIALFHESPKTADASIGRVQAAVYQEHDRLTQLADEAP